MTVRPIRYQVSLTAQAILADPGLLPRVRTAGVDRVWLVAWGYGHWFAPPAQLAEARRACLASGLEAEALTLPLGHPGEALGITDTAFPLSPPAHWTMAEDHAGKRFCGTSLHEPAIAENVAAVRELAGLGFREVLLDDDARLARAPGRIGGCFCPLHRAAFLHRTGRPVGDWEQLRADVAAQRDTPLLRAWLDLQQDEFAAMMAALDAADPRVRIGLCVMYLGDAKAGIRLEALRSRQTRIGEYHFNDHNFAAPGQRCAELFSALLHRRFVPRELALSETTAFPHDQLSPANLVAKLAVPLIADLGTVLFMSGVNPFPPDRWQALAEAIPRHRAAAARLAGARMDGPLVHRWDEADRCSGRMPDARWLALGLPFRVAGDGEDAGPMVSAPWSDDWPAWWTWRRRLLADIGAAPFVVEEEPTVCAWYPDAGCAVLWDQTGRSRDVTLRQGGTAQRVALPALGWRVVDLA